MSESLRFLAAAALVAALPASATAQRAPSAPRRAAAATMLAAQRSLIVDRDPGAAKAGFQSAIRQDPTFAAPRFNLGVLAEAREEWGEAAKWFGEYLALDSTSSWSARARNELAVAKTRAAANGDAVSASRAEYDRHIQLGRRLVAAAMLDDALAEAKRAHALSPNSWEAYALASAAVAPTGHLSQALALLDTAIARAPADAAAPLRSSRNSLEHADQASNRTR